MIFFGLLILFIQNCLTVRNGEDEGPESQNPHTVASFSGNPATTVGQPPGRGATAGRDASTSQ
jgi:hypothetical protein